MSNSNLVSYTKISPNKTSPRKHSIDTISIHCMAGNLSIEKCGDIFSNIDRKASSNYGIGSDGRIGMYVEESDKSWCTSNSNNDNRAITIEVANDGGANTGWHVSDKAYESLVRLLVDICQRNGIKQLLWRGDKHLIGQVDKQNMTVHRWFAAKACPGDYLYNLHPKIASDVNNILNNSNSKIQNESILSKETDEIIWNSLKRAGFTDVAAAGIMGNLYDESHLCSNNLQNSFNKKFNMTDEMYTHVVNNGSYSEIQFVKDGAGYGIAQWTYWTRKQGLYEYTIKHGFKIDDLSKQIEYLIIEISGLMSILNGADSIRNATYIVLTQYEKPGDQGIAVQNRRTEYAQKFYNKFSKNSKKQDGFFKVKIKRNNIRIKKGPGINYEDTGKTTGIGIFTIIETKDRWGLLKSYSNNKDGWIILDGLERI